MIGIPSYKIIQTAFTAINFHTQEFNLHAEILFIYFPFAGKLSLLSQTK